ncbi:MAG TPA: stage II sporulation protein M [Oscillospiraceae bacterium]|nr:stage II sporulation protein M [Oscillospiraceae bacterium]
MTKTFFLLIRENRSWIILAILFFVMGLVSAYSALGQEPAFLQLLEESLGALSELGEEIFSGSPLTGVFVLFGNNLIATMQIIFLGIFLGLPSLSAAIANGAVLGFLSFQLVQEGIAPLPFLLSGVLPHGIFELPAFFLCVALGLKLGYHVIFPLPELTRRQTFQKIFKEIGIALPYILGLLAIAAVIEVFITPLLLGSLMGLI